MLYMKNKGMACNDLTINVFNADCGIDSIAFVDALINKGHYCPVKVDK